MNITPNEPAIKTKKSGSKAATAGKVLEGDYCSLFSDFDISLLQQGRHYMLYKHFGAHALTYNGQPGVYFAVWAPGANYVSVTGDFNFWDKGSHPMHARWDSSGIWELFIPGIEPAALYKYHVGNESGFITDKADPFGFEMEMPPLTASRVFRTGFKWSDKKWTEKRAEKNARERALSIYEVHIGSWRRIPEEGNRWLTYRELATHLPDY